MKRFIIRSGRSQFQLIKLPDLEYIRAEKGGTLVKCKDKEFKTPLPFKELLIMLKDSIFQCHRSHAVNIDNIKSFTSESLKLSKKTLSVGPMYKNEFLEIMFERNVLLSDKGDV